MSDHPMIFSAPMILALLAGRKTQTRRLIKGAPDGRDRGWHCDRRDGRPVFVAAPGAPSYPARVTIQPGDRLWAREAHFIVNDGHGADYLIRYAADGRECWRTDTKDLWNDFPGATKRPSIFMPRWASRLTLTVTQVRVQRLHDISEDDAVAEGCFKAATGRVFDSPAALHPGGDEWASARDWYMDLWETLHGPQSWDACPWVVALTFGVTMANIDTLRAAAAASPIVERVTA